MNNTNKLLGVDMTVVNLMYSWTLPIIEPYGQDGIIALQAHMRRMFPQKEFRTIKFHLAFKAIKKEQNRLIIKCRDENPQYTGAYIAEKFGITRERIRQILNKAHRKTTECRYGTRQICPKCGGRKSGNSLMCTSCSLADRRTKISCLTCGKLFDMSKKLVIFRINKRNQKHFFCSQRCHGIWLAKNFGFQKGHEPTVPRKYDYDKVLELLVSKKPKKVAEELSMPIQAVYYIHRWGREKGVLS